MTTDAAAAVSRAAGGSVRLTLDEAVGIIVRARAAAEELGVTVSIAVVDDTGYLLAFHRMDGARWISAEIAQGKAFTAAAYGEPSAAQGEKARSLPQFAGAITAMTCGRYIPQAGGLPVLRDGRCVGAAGASGSSGQQDEDVVRRALELL